MPAESIPPVGPNLLMHFFENPKHANASPMLFRRMPRRLRQKLEPCPIRGSSIGWGIQVVEGLNRLKLFACGLIVFVISLLFGIIWSAIRKDIQGGFTVASYLLTFFVFSIGTIEAATEL